MQRPATIAKGANTLSIILPLINGMIYQYEINSKLNCGIITYEQSEIQGAANGLLTSLNILGGTTILPATAAATSHPIGWAVVGGTAFGFDMTVAQNTYNYTIEGQPFWPAFLNGRADAVDAYTGVLGGDHAGVDEFLNTWAGPPMISGTDWTINVSILTTRGTPRETDQVHLGAMVY